jgi:hypothetical protein
MSPSDNPFSSVGDAVIVIGVLLAAVSGLLFLLSPPMRKEMREKWNEDGKMRAIAEWGEWLWAIMAVLLLVSAGIGIWLSAS